MSDLSDNEIFDPEQEQEIKFNWTPKVKIFLIFQIVLPEINITSDEETDDLLFKARAKLYRWKDNEWKERGTGELKILRNRKTTKIRVVMRQEKTFKLVCNFMSKG